MHPLKQIVLLTSLSFYLLSTKVIAQSRFNTGPLIEGYGKQAQVVQTTPKSMQVNADSQFKVVFDVSKQADKGRVNRSLESLARFLNMHVAHGVKPENIELALVVHGGAGFDLLNDEHYQAKFGQKNPNTTLLTLLVKHQTQVFMCGQSASYMGIENNQLNKQVSVALSAMTAHATLQQQGYTLNPF